MATSSSSPQHRRVFVGNIPYDLSEEQLIQICEEVGPVVSCRLVLDRDTGKPKGYGFCEYKDEETALSARRNLQGYQINGRQLRVDFAENGKGSDRNKEQGHGGPGSTSTSDAHKSSPGHPIPGDSSLHQPIGHLLAATAATTMDRALSGAQTSRLPSMQNCFQNHSVLGNDPLTRYLAKMSREQLNEIMFEMKALVAQHKALAQQLLQRCPQLPKALFQALIMLGMVPTQMMQMVNKGKSWSSVLEPSLQCSLPYRNQLITSHPGQIVLQKESPEPQISSALQNHVILQQSSISPQQIPVQPPFHHPLPSQTEMVIQGAIPSKFGITTQTQTFCSLSNQLPDSPLPASKSMISQVQPSIPEHSLGSTKFSQHPPSIILDGPQQSYLSPLPTFQSHSSSYPTLQNRLDPLMEASGTNNAVNHDLTSGGSMHSTSVASSTHPGDSMHSISVVSSTPPGGSMQHAVEISGVRSDQLKRQKLENGGGAVHFTMSDELRQPEKQMPQLPPDVETVLLQQVRNLTPEQISSLPLEQQQQVLQLQKMLVQNL